MGRLTLAQAAQWCGGSVDPKYADVTFLGADNDSRTIRAGQLFVALQGARDGHTFIPAAMENGASAALCTHCEGDYPAIVVEDVRIALGQIAQHERMRIGMKVVGITGAVGKSTTKEMAACILKSTYRVSKTPVDQDDDIGMPMAILAMPEDTQVAVLEMGMNQFRAIAYLSSIARPDVTVILNVGAMHIERLGSINGVLKARLDVLGSMPENGKIILNGDDGLLLNIQKTLGLRHIYFGVRNTTCEIGALDIQEEAEGLRFRVKYGDTEFPVELPLEGLHYVSDALAAITVGMELGVTPECIQESLRGFQKLAGCQDIFAAGEFTVIQDWYNASPESMAAALSVLGGKHGRRVAVLGDMTDQGSCTQAEYYRVGRIAAERADFLLVCGPNSGRVVNGAFTGGMAPSRALAFEDKEQMLAALKRIARPGDVILFKGSRQTHMELVLERFLQTQE